MSPLFWITGLLFVGLFVMVLEVFIPSGGLLGFISIAIAATIAAILINPRRPPDGIKTSRTITKRPTKSKPVIQNSGLILSPANTEQP
jgi:membrane-bound ClpP family serine protease